MWVLQLCFQYVETDPKLDSEKGSVCVGIYSVFKGCACRRGGDHMYIYIYMYASAFASIFTSTSFASTGIYICIYLHLHLHLRLYLYLYLHLRTCLYIYNLPEVDRIHGFKECLSRVLSKIICHLLQDGCICISRYLSLCWW